MRAKLIVPFCTLPALLGACGSSEVSPTAEEMSAFEFPPSLSPFGDGYPIAGDPCRQLGESDAVIDMLDDSSVLVGCPTEADAQAIDGALVATIDGVSIVSVPMGDANQGMKDPMVEIEDALVPGTDYHATAMVPCATDGSDNRSGCNAGVKRNWGEDGTSLVEVTKPDGSKRAIFFRGTEPYGADSAQADGSAGWDFTVERVGDESIITFGPESYVIPDMMITGG